MSCSTPSPPRLAMIVILGLQVLCACGRTPVITGQCCAAGLLDPGKLLQPNLGGTPANLMTLVLDFVQPQTFDLANLLRKPGDEAVVWSSNDIELRNSILELKSQPGDDSVIVYRIDVRRATGGQRDEFRLISIPAGTRQRFDAWFAHERQDMGWLSLLPPVYSSLGPAMSNPEPKNCATHYWDGVHKLDSRLHPGGAYEMRSMPVDGHGHQAVYDASGRLIREGAGAGSADKAAPRLLGSGLIRHRDQDVKPYVWAVQLDGNPVNPTWMFVGLDAPISRLGEHIKSYLSVRPALWGGSPEVAAGTCIAPGNPASR